MPSEIPVNWCKTVNYSRAANNEHVATTVGYAPLAIAFVLVARFVRIKHRTASCSHVVLWNSQNFVSHLGTNILDA